MGSNLHFQGECSRAGDRAYVSENHVTSQYSKGRRIQAIRSNPNGLLLFQLHHKRAVPSVSALFHLLIGYVFCYNLTHGSQCLRCEHDGKTTIQCQTRYPSTISTTPPQRQQRWSSPENN